LPARRSLSILHLAGKASIRRRPVNSALGGMQPISSGVSVLFRWGPALAIVVVSLWAMGTAVLDPSVPLTFAYHWWTVVGLAAASAFHYFTAWQLADAVFDCGDYLLIRRGSTSMRVPLQDIRDVRLGLRLGRNHSQEIILKLKQQTALSQEVRFLPATSRLPPEYTRVGLFHHLRLRVERAARNAA
jgi:hypothetical protein